jgi:hypothetical protein
MDKQLFVKRNFGKITICAANKLDHFYKLDYFSKPVQHFSGRGHGVPFHLTCCMPVKN